MQSLSDLERPHRPPLLRPGVLAIDPALRLSPLSARFHPWLAEDPNLSSSPGTLLGASPLASGSNTLLPAASSFPLPSGVPGGGAFVLDHTLLSGALLPPPLLPPPPTTLLPRAPLDLSGGLFDPLALLNTQLNTQGLNTQGLNTQGLNTQGLLSSLSSTPAPPAMHLGAPPSMQHLLHEPSPLFPPPLAGALPLSGVSGLANAAPFSIAPPLNLTSGQISAAAFAMARARGEAPPCFAGGGQAPCYTPQMVGAESADGSPVHLATPTAARMTALPSAQASGHLPAENLPHVFTAGGARLFLHGGMQGMQGGGMQAGAGGMENGGLGGPPCLASGHLTGGQIPIDCSSSPLCLPTGSFCSQHSTQGLQSLFASPATSSMFFSSPNLDPEHFIQPIPFPGSLASRAGPFQDLGAPARPMLHGGGSGMGGGGGSGMQQLDAHQQHDFSTAFTTAAALLASGSSLSSAVSSMAALYPQQAASAAAAGLPPSGTGLVRPSVSKPCAGGEALLQRIQSLGATPLPGGGLSGGLTRQLSGGVADGLMGGNVLGGAGGEGPGGLGVGGGGGGGAPPLLSTAAWLPQPKSFGALPFGYRAS